jgi:hypothetical protein
MTESGRDETEFLARIGQHAGIVRKVALSYRDPVAPDRASRVARRERAGVQRGRLLAAFAREA